MDAKNLKNETALGERNDVTKYTQASTAPQYERSKQYQDIGSNSFGKVDTHSARPCAVIGPDRVVPPPAPSESYLKKIPVEPWPCGDGPHCRPPEYHHKMNDYQQPMRNISPRQTFQENMQRVMVPPRYSSLKINEDLNCSSERTVPLSKGDKFNVPAETKFCEVPYPLNPTEHKSVRNPEMCMPNANPAFVQSVPHGWSSGGINVRHPRPYGAPELYQYPDYSSCAGPRHVSISRPHRTVPEDPSHPYAGPYYHEGNIRFKPYPTIKERYPQARYDYIGNYSNPYHPPPFPTHKYDLQKSAPPHPYPSYPRVPLKYLDGRMADPLLDSYQRHNQHSNYNLSYHNQVINPPYAPVQGNLQNKLHGYPPDGTAKPVVANKLPYESNKMYIEYENARSKTYPMPENIYESSRYHPIKSQIVMPNYASVNMHSMASQPYYRKENLSLKNYEYVAHFRHGDPLMNPLPKATSQFSPNTMAISPSDSNTSNDTTQTQGTSQEDCGYVSQSPSTSVKSIDCAINKIPNEFYRRYDYRYGHIMRNSHISCKPELNSNRNTNSKGNKNIDVRQFLQMWNEGDEESTENNKEVQTAKDTNDFLKQCEIVNNQEPLYVLGFVNVPSEELDKYEHIQKISKLPENIKGYNNTELLDQFEEIIESSKINNYAKTSTTIEISSKNNITTQGLGVIPRPISPLDVEAKISQSVIHKEVRCNFEIKPCSPKMLNAAVAAPIQTILGERVIEKVSNPNINLPEALHGTNNKEDNSKAIRYEVNQMPLINNVKIPSCKMINAQYPTKDTIDSIKSNFSLQDFESSSGVCLTSLPRLDNDIELNFPEVNQQFINANKVESVITAFAKDLPSLNVEHTKNAIDNDKINLSQESEFNFQLPSKIESEKEFVKLSKYRKLKKSDTEFKDPQSNIQATRIDSVIIKNPDNIKDHTENSKQSPIPIVNKLVDEVQQTPINLSPQCEESVKNIDDFNKISTPIYKDTSTNTQIDCKSNINTNPNILNENIKDPSSHKITIHTENQSTMLCKDDSVNHFKTNCLDVTELIKNNLTHSNNTEDASIQESLCQDNNISEIVVHVLNDNKTIITPNEDISNNKNDCCMKKIIYEETISDETTTNIQKTDVDDLRKENHLNEIHPNNKPNVSYNNLDQTTVETDKKAHIKEIHDTKKELSTSQFSEDIDNSAKYESLSTLPNYINDVVHKKYDNITQNCEYSSCTEANNKQIKFKTHLEVKSNCKIDQKCTEPTITVEIQNENNNSVSIESKSSFTTSIYNKTCFNEQETSKTNKVTISESNRENIDTNLNEQEINKDSRSKSNIENIKTCFTQQTINKVLISDNIAKHIDTYFIEQDTSKHLISDNSVETIDHIFTEQETIEGLIPDSYDETISNNYTKQEMSKLLIPECVIDNIDHNFTEKETSKDLISVSNVENIETCFTKQRTNEVLMSGSNVTKIETYFTEQETSKPSISENNGPDKCFIEQETNNLLTSESSTEGNTCSKINEENIDTTFYDQEINETSKIIISENNSQSIDTCLIKQQTSNIILENSNEHIFVEPSQLVFKQKFSKGNVSEEATRQLSPKVLRYISKELLSPWIQNLLIYNEGICSHVRTKNPPLPPSPVSYDVTNQINENSKTDCNINMNMPCKEIMKFDKQESVTTNKNINSTQNLFDTKEKDYVDEVDYRVLTKTNSNMEMGPNSEVNNENVNSNEVENDLKQENELDNVNITAKLTPTVVSDNFNTQHHIEKYDFKYNVKGVPVIDLNKIDADNTNLIEEPLQENNYNLVCNKIQNLTKRNICLKRSFSDSALHAIGNDYLDKPEEKILEKWPHKRIRIQDSENSVESQLIAEGFCNVIQNSRRNSVSSIYRDNNVSFCILIDDNCVITEESDESEKICFTDITEEFTHDVHNELINEDNNTEMLMEDITYQQDICDYSDSFTLESSEEKLLEEAWVEDVACVETVVTDEIVENNLTPTPTSPTSLSDYDCNHEESGVFGSNISDHTDKVKYIYGDKMCTNDAQFVETLYRTPQMDVNKTLNYRESHITGECNRYYDTDSLEKVLTDTNCAESISRKLYDIISPMDYINSKAEESDESKCSQSKDYQNNDSIANSEDNNNYQNQLELKEIQPGKMQNDTVHSCESSVDNVFSYMEREENPIYSSSPEVSSTTSEEKSIFLKITNYKGSEVSSQINNDNPDKHTKMTSLFMEEKYSNKNLPSIRPLITKAAQKYIPPLKETIQSFKIKLPLPQHSLIKLKQLKISKEQPKPVIKLKLNNYTIKTETPKKIKPKFEDVLKSIDEIQFKKHKEKTKQRKKSIPKVVIKKNENGSHYASTSSKDTFNPDLTGSKWQPWVFIEKNIFIDKMALKGKTKAIYSHRKNTYVLAEKFQKYKSIGSAKFFISQPKLEESKGQLKYTIKLKHHY